MDFSMASIWGVTKLFITDPAEASRRVVAAGLPVNVSILMILLSAVVSTVFTGIQRHVVDPPAQVLEFSDGTQATITLGGPIEQGVVTALISLIFAYLVYAIGRRFGGQGALSAILSVIAMLQIAFTVIEGAMFITFFTLPILTLFISILGLIVLIRGLGYAVKIGHGFDSLGAPAMVVILAGVVAIVLVAFLAGITGLGFDVEMV